MSSAKYAGRAMGAALLIQIVFAQVGYFRLLTPATSPDFLTGAAGHALQIRIGLLVTFGLAAMTFVVALAALPIVRHHSERMAFALLAMSTAGLATMAMESLATRFLLTLSLEAARSGGVTESLETLAASTRIARTGAHYTNLLMSHSTMLLLYATLFRCSLIPRVLAGAGVLGATLSTGAVAMPLLGARFNFQLIAPMGAATIAIIVWLLAKGLAERRPERAGAVGPPALAPA